MSIERVGRPCPASILTSFVLVTIMSFGAAAAASSAELFGTWSNSRYGVTMNVNRNGTFTFTGPQGTSGGRWSVNGNVFMMAEPSGRVIAYRVVSLTDTRLQLVDAFGVPLVYERPAGWKSPARRTAGTVRGGGTDSRARSATGKSPSTVIAERKGKTLRSGDLEPLFTVAVFMAAKPLTDSEKATLTTQCKKMFHRDPAKLRAGLGELKSDIDKVNAMKDAGAIATARQRMLYEALKRMNARGKGLVASVLAPMVFSKARVLATDHTSGLVLTSSDLDAAMAWLMFGHNCFCSIMRNNIPVPQAKQALIRRQFIEKFNVLPPDRKALACSAAVMWAVLAPAMQKMNAYQKGQLQGRMAARFPDSLLVAQGAASRGGYYANGGGYRAAPSGSGASSAARLSRMRREMMARQNCFNIMNNMMLNNHALGLNIANMNSNTYYTVQPGY